MCLEVVRPPDVALTFFFLLKDHRNVLITQRVSLQLSHCLEYGSRDSYFSFKMYVVVSQVTCLGMANIVGSNPAEDDKSF